MSLTQPWPLANITVSGAAQESFTAGCWVVFLIWHSISCWLTIRVMYVHPRNYGKYREVEKCTKSEICWEGRLSITPDPLYLVQFSSVAQLCPTLCNPMDCSMPGLPVHHQLPESTQTHDHWVGDAIQPSHPLSSPSPPALTLSQHQGLFQLVSSLHQVAKVLEFQL